MNQMRDLVDVLEKLEGQHQVGVLSESTEEKIELASDLRYALTQAREFAAKVDMLHETIAGNIEHSIAAWLKVQADEASRQAHDAEMIEDHAAAVLVQYGAMVVRRVAAGVEKGEWKA